MWISHLTSLLVAYCSLTEVYCLCGDERGIRLVTGETALEGRVEICYHREWGTVCDDGWDSVDTSVACRELGFSAGGSVAVGQFGRGTGAIVLGRLNCYGDEIRLRDCSAESYPPYCDHSQDAGVRCQPNLPQNVRINTITDTSVVITWQPPGAVLPDNYNITLAYTNNTRSSNQTHTTAVQVLGTATRLEYNQLLPELEYSYCVCAIYGTVKSSFCYIFQTSSLFGTITSTVSPLAWILCFVLVLFVLLLALAGTGLAYPRCIRSRVKDKKCLSSISRFLDERIYMSSNSAYLQQPQPPSTQATTGTAAPSKDNDIYEAYEMLEDDPPPPPVTGFRMAHKTQINAAVAKMKGPRAIVTGNQDYEGYEIS